MKIIYIAETSITNKSAYTHHVMKMCDAFSQLNHDLILLIPNFEKKIHFNKIRKNFLLNGRKGFKIKTIQNRKLTNFVLRAIFAFKVSKFIKKNKPNIILTRSFISSIFLTLFKIKHILEIHSELQSITKFLMINLNYINSKYILKKILISKSLNKIYKFKAKDILILHDGVDIKNFKYSKETKEIKTATYVGSFYKGRGIDIILELAKKFKKIKFNLYGEKNKFNKVKLKNVKFLGYINYNEVPKVLSDSDVLLMPYSKKVYVRADNINTANYCSPLKMFDYLAAGKIIMSSKLDGICEVLKHKNNSIIVNKYDPKSWIKYMEDIIKKKYNLSSIRKHSLKTATKFTWYSRAQKITKSYIKLSKND